MSEILDVTIIVLNWNGRSYLEACLGALLLQTRQPRRIVLVDNNSTDDSIALVQRRFPTVEIVKNERNLGYAGGNNVVLRELDSDLAVLINPDIVVSRDWLQQMLAALEEDSFIGIAGCKLYYPGAKQLQHAGGQILPPQSHAGTLGNVQQGRWPV